MADPFDGNTFVRFDQRTDPPVANGRVWICDVLGGHEGAVSWEEWSSWPVIKTEGEST